MVNYYQILFLSFVILAIKSPNFANADLPAEEIVGGEVVSHSYHKYQVRVIGRNRSSQFSCGGSILDDYHIISAAHCFYDPESIEWFRLTYKIVAGATDLKDLSRDDRSNWRTAYVKKIHIPTMFVNDLYSNVSPPRGDIAVIQLDRSLNLTDNKHLDYVFPPFDFNSLFEDDRAIVSGYGVSGFNKRWNWTANKEEWIGISDGKLRDAYTTVLSNSECQSEWFGKNITDKHLCAAIDQRDPFEPEGVCEGDSGGPLIYLHNVLIGVVSIGPADPPCNEKYRSEIYTRVSAFEDFIYDAFNDKNEHLFEWERKTYLPLIDENFFTDFK